MAVHKKKFYPEDSAPSQRFRFEQYYTALKSHGFKVETAPFMDAKTWQILYKEGRFLTKAIGIFKGYFKRWMLLFKLYKYDHVFIHREIKPLGWPILDWLICKFSKHIIYDFDDAVWLKNYSESNRYFSFLKRYSTVKKLCKWADVVSCGNAFLADYAQKFNHNACIIPTTVDTDNYHNQISKHNNLLPVIGWTGSHSTARYLNDLVPALQRLESEFKFEFRVISDEAPSLDIKSLKFFKWHKNTEIETLSVVDIGVMPLSDSPWAQGKCGFKAIQYMALGILAVVSPVGVNTQIVDHGINGYYCTTEEDWYETLKELIQNKTLLLKMGENARKKIEEHYSVNANRAIFLNLFAQ